MCRRKILVVVMLITVLEATPWQPKKRRITMETTTTRKHVITYKSKAIGDIDSESANPDDLLLATSTFPVHEIKEPTAKNKEILHKSHKHDSTEFPVKPLTIDGVETSGSNNCVIWDNGKLYGEIIDEVYYEHYEEYIEEFWGELMYECDVDPW